MDKIHESGAVLLGGHTVDDAELKYGLSVTGTVHPQKIITNRGAQRGDALILTQPLGVGIISTANKGRYGRSGRLRSGCRFSMVQLNRQAAEIMISCDAHSATDITGFGLLGHASEMARASNRSFILSYSRIPILPGTRALAIMGLIPGGAYCNQAHFTEVAFSRRVLEADRIILYDPQSSGGLLMSIPAEAAGECVQKLHEAGISDSAIIGEVVPPEKDLILVET